MKTSRKTISVSSAVKRVHNRSLDLAPEYQRGAVWSRKRQTLLIDSMLKGYDLPKFYMRQLSGDKELYEVVDGVQRLTSMVNFMNGDFALPKLSSFAGLRYKDLPEEIGLQFDEYQLDFAILEGFDEDDVRDMFLRLQNGQKLNAAEELNAISGDMHDYIEEISKLPFFTRKTSFGSSRGSFRHVSAQCALLAISGYGDVRKEDLKKFYVSHRNWKISETAIQLRKVLTWLGEVFKDSDPALRNRGQTVSIIMLAFDLWGNYVLKGNEVEFLEAIHNFDRNVLENDKEFKDYLLALSHSSDQLKSIEIRREFMLSGFIDFVSGLVAKDPQRAFKLPDRVLAWYKAEGKCQTEGCTQKINFQDFHADHKKAWSIGGRTDQKNLQVLCKYHNLSKGAK